MINSGKSWSANPGYFLHHCKYFLLQDCWWRQIVLVLVLIHWTVGSTVQNDESDTIVSDKVSEAIAQLNVTRSRRQTVKSLPLRLPRQVLPPLIGGFVHLGGPAPGVHRGPIGGHEVSRGPIAGPGFRAGPVGGPVPPVVRDNVVLPPPTLPTKGPATMIQVFYSYHHA